MKKLLSLSLIALCLGLTLNVAAMENQPATPKDVTPAATGDPSSESVKPAEVDTALQVAAKNPTLGWRLLSGAGNGVKYPFVKFGQLVRYIYAHSPQLIAQTRRGRIYEGAAITVAITAGAIYLAQNPGASVAQLGTYIIANFHNITGW